MPSRKESGRGGGLTIATTTRYIHSQQPSLRLFDFSAEGTVMPGPTILETDLPNLPLKRGKVHDVYDLGEELLIVSTDRISAFSRDTT